MFYLFIVYSRKGAERAAWFQDLVNYSIPPNQIQWLKRPKQQSKVLAYKNKLVYNA